MYQVESDGIPHISENTTFGGIRITDYTAFFEKYKSQFTTIFEVSHKHTQPVHLNMGSDLFKENSLVILSEISGDDLIGVITQIETEVELQEDSLNSLDKTVYIHPLCRHDKSDVENPNLYTTVEENLQYISPESNQVLELTLDGTNHTLNNTDFNLDLFILISDQFLLQLFDDSANLAALHL